jgi:hypothetical protein
MLIFSLVFGIVAGIIAGQSGDGVGLVSRVRSDLGGLSAPWVLVAWFAGARTSRVTLGAILGLVATMIALVAFYVVSGTVEAMGNDVVSSSLRWMSANRVWFEAGLVSGPVFGALGAWWRRRGSPDAVLVAGILLAGEPLVLWSTGAVWPNGVLSPLSGLPLVVRIVPGLGVGGRADALAISVYAAEMLAGVGLIVVGLRHAGSRRVAAPITD